MKPLFYPILSLVVCSVLFFGNAECLSSTVIQPSPTASPSNSTTHHNSSAVISSTLLPNASTAYMTSTPNMTSVFTSSWSNKTTVMSVLSMNTSVIVSTSHLPNSTIHFSSMNVSLTSMIMSSSAGNHSIYNSTVHPTSLPTYSINMSSSAVQNASTSHVVPTMTPSPSPATTVFPSSSVPPTTPTPLPKGKYSVSKNGTKCLLFWLSLEFTITYKNNSGKQLQTKVVMPSTGKASGTCEENLASVSISWANYTFEAYFYTAKGSNGRLDAAVSHWSAANITFTAQTKNNPDFVNANDTIISQSVTKESDLHWLSGSLGKSLNCSKAEELKTESIHATIENLRLQPFEVQSGAFAEADTCSPGPTTKPTKSPSKKSNNTVAIAVGCSLAGLVLIVLIGYFIGKRRKRTGNGYRKL